MPVPNATKTALLDGDLSLSGGGDTLRVLLLDDSSAYTFDPDAHDFVSDVLAAGTEMSGTGYTRRTIAGQATSTDDDGDGGVFDADNLEWVGIDAGAIQTVVIYKQVGGDDTTPGDDRVLIVIDDADSDELPFQTTGSDVTLNWDLGGILSIK